MVHGRMMIGGEWFHGFAFFFLLFNSLSQKLHEWGPRAKGCFLFKLLNFIVIYEGATRKFWV